MGKNACDEFDQSRTAFEYPIRLALGPHGERALRRGLTEGSLAQYLIRPTRHAASIGRGLMQPGAVTPFAGADWFWFCCVELPATRRFSATLRIGYSSVRLPTAGSCILQQIRERHL
jgi:hypothetical protein